LIVVGVDSTIMTESAELKLDCSRVCY